MPKILSQCIYYYVPDDGSAPTTIPCLGQTQTEGKTDYSQVSTFLQRVHRVEGFVSIKSGWLDLKQAQGLILINTSDKLIITLGVQDGSRFEPVEVFNHIPPERS